MPATAAHRTLATTALILLFAAGCIDNPPPAAPETPPKDSEPQPVGPTSLAYTGCRELDFVLEAPADAFKAPKMRPKTVDAAGQFTQVIINAMSCAERSDGASSRKPATGFFGMVPVETVPGATIDGINSYYWLVGVLTDDETVRSAWEARGVEATTANVSLVFSDFGGNKDARSRLTIQERGNTLEAEATMLGPSTRGAAGKMAIYTTNETAPLRVHRIDFTDYSSYPRGAVTLRPGSWFGVLPEQVPEPRPAYENLDYGATFHLDQKVV